MTGRIYYVYVHGTPHTNDICYVGKGCYGRAWDVTRNRSGNPEHVAWMKNLSDCGYLPRDWVRIVKHGLTEKAAYRLEKEFLHQIGGTIFNGQSGERNFQAKLTNDQAREIYSRAKSGETHKSLASEYGVSRSTVSMIVSRKQWRAATACLTK